MIFTLAKNHWIKIGIDPKKNHTLNLTYVPTNRNDVTYKWIFKLKYIPHGDIHRGESMV